MQELHMFIGIPGSGKSTQAKNWQARFGKYCPIFEADMFFEKDRKYDWKPELLRAAHQWCFKQVEETLKSGHSVIVSNTFLTPRERHPYIELAKKYNAKLKVWTCTGNYQNVHGVPQETIERMRKKFVPYSKEEEIF